MALSSGDWALSLGEPDIKILNRVFKKNWGILTIFSLYLRALYVRVLCLLMPRFENITPRQGRAFPWQFKRQCLDKNYCASYLSALFSWVRYGIKINSYYLNVTRTHFLHSKNFSEFYFIFLPRNNSLTTVWTGRARNWPTSMARVKNRCS